MSEGLRVFLLDKTATLPFRATPDSIGYDLYSAEEKTIQPHSRATVDLKLAIAVPPGTYGRIAPRSSLALGGIDVGGGVIDPDYRGAVKVILINHSEDVFVITIGLKIAQLILERAVTSQVVQTSSLDELGTTTRGNGGFGSTGK